MQFPLLLPGILDFDPRTSDQVSGNSYVGSNIANKPFKIFGYCHS